MYEEIVKSTAKMVALWQCYGFCHGVLNTDNMSMMGLTIDYGPYGFLEHYDPKFICNHSDDQGRYRYEAQPEICKWNLGKLAEALDPVLNVDEAKAFLDENYWVFYNEVYQTRLAEKLGLVDINQTQNMLTNLSLSPNAQAEKQLVEGFWAVMKKTGSDFTNTFRDLAGLTKDLSMTDEDNIVVDKLLTHAAPKQQLLAQAKSPYEDQH